MISIKEMPGYYGENIWDSLEFAKSLPPINKQDNLHLFWAVPKEFSDKHVTVIKSILATQDLNKLNIFLWSNIDLSKNDLLKPYLQYLNIKIWSFEKESKDTPLENQISNNLYNLDSTRYVSSDLFRLLCLYKYGGFYIDMDCVILRDLSPLKNIQFVYQWSQTGASYSDSFRANNAVLRLDKESSLSLELLSRLKNTPPSPQSFNWGSYLFSNFLEREDLKILPCCWFDTEWHLDNAGVSWNPFKKYEGCDELYNGAFTWHWHNKWDMPVEKGSKMDILDFKMSELLSEKIHANL